MEEKLADSVENEWIEEWKRKEKGIGKGDIRFHLFHPITTFSFNFSLLTSTKKNFPCQLDELWIECVRVINTKKKYHFLFVFLELKCSFRVVDFERISLQKIPQIWNPFFSFKVNRFSASTTRFSTRALHRYLKFLYFV